MYNILMSYYLPVLLAGNYIETVSMFVYS